MFWKKKGGYKPFILKYIITAQHCWLEPQRIQILFGYCHSPPRRVLENIRIQLCVWRLRVSYQSCLLVFRKLVLLPERRARIPSGTTTHQIPIWFSTMEQCISMRRVHFVWNNVWVGCQGQKTHQNKGRQFLTRTWYCRNDQWNQALVLMFSQPVSIFKLPSDGSLCFLSKLLALNSLLQSLSRGNSLSKQYTIKTLWWYIGTVFE